MPFDLLSTAPLSKDCVLARSSFSPISNVPADVLLHIFYLGTFAASEEAGAIDFPVLVSHTCRAWRELALLTPTLWTTIVVTACASSSANSSLQSLIEPNQSHTPTSPFPFAKMFLSRSGTLPLRVCLDLRSPAHPLYVSDLAVDHEFPSDLSIELLHVLLPYAARFREFTLLSDIWPTILFTLLKLRGVSMPLLEMWDVRRCNLYHCFNDDFKPRQYRTPTARLLADTENANAATLYSRLKDVTLCGTHLAWPSWSVIGLTSLTINYLAKEVRPSFSTLRRILLSNAETLTRLEIQGAAPVRVSDANDSDAFSESVIGSIFLPVLTDLAIGYTTPTEVMPLVQALQAPKLISLQLHDIYRHMYTGVLDGGEMVDSDATPLFEALVKYMPYPLSSIQNLTLGSVWFRDQVDRVTITSSDMDVAHCDPRVLMPLQLLLSLTSLKTLTLDRPDPIVLSALNTPLPTPSAEVGTKPAMFAAHSLVHLTLTCSSYAVDFLRNRVGYTCYQEPSPFDLVMWERLTIGIPGGVQALSEACIGEGFDIRCLTKVVEVLDESPAATDPDDDDDVDMDEVDAFVEEWMS